MQYFRRLALVALFATAFFPSASYAGDNPFIGVWESQIDEHAQREISVRHIDNQIVHGWYCIRMIGRSLHQINDFSANGSAPGTVKARATKRKLSTIIRDYRIVAVPNQDRDHLDVTARSSNKKRRFEVHRVDPSNAPCSPRIIPLEVSGASDTDRPAGETYADAGAVASDPHPLIGFWTGRRSNGLVIELSVTKVNAGHVHGLYCNIWGSGWRATDIHPELAGAIRATATEEELGFRHEHNKREFQFILDDSDPAEMTYKQTVPGRGTDTVDMVRTDDPKCAARVIVPTT